MKKDNLFKVGVQLAVAFTMFSCNQQPKDTVAVADSVAKKATCCIAPPFKAGSI